MTEPIYTRFRVVLKSRLPSNAVNYSFFISRSGSSAGSIMGGRLIKEFGLPQIKFHLHKVIPFGAGLGGG